MKMDKLKKDDIQLEKVVSELKERLKTIVNISPGVWVGRYDVIWFARHMS